MTIERFRMALEECCREVGVPPLGYALEMSLARAALNAIAEPTPEMIKAIVNIMGGFDMTSSEAALTWRAAHAAMMKEEK